MQNSILLTSFTTWMPHQTSNAADDLLEQVSGTIASSVSFLRKLPVDFELAPQQVIDRFNALKPDILVCCGMAEERDRLHLESQAVVNGVTWRTKLDLETLSRGLPMTEISHDAGGFVCNALYFEALNHLRTQERQNHCLFAHVPLLTAENINGIKDDFLTLLYSLGTVDMGTRETDSPGKVLRLDAAPENRNCAHLANFGRGRH